MDRKVRAGTTGKLPLALQITEMLMRDIRNGVLPHGERLPPERQMAKDLHISLGTLRKALADLESRGLLTRIQGSGNYINGISAKQDVYALFRLERAYGPAEPTADLISVQRLRKPADQPSIGTSESALRFRRIRYLDGDPAALEEIWLDGRYAREIVAEQIGDSLYQFYRDVLGCRITRVEDRVNVGRLPSWAPKFLSCLHNGDWGYVERLSRDQNGEAVEFSHTWFDPLTVRFVSR